jgi:argininosuccinate lyase
VSFDPQYLRLVLDTNFEDAKATFLSPLMAIHRAHLVMLAEQRIVRREDAAAIRDALDGIALEDVRCASYDGSCEDLFFYVERLIATACGAETAGRLHTARSRNDIDMTMYRMRQREMILTLLETVAQLRATLLDQAARHVHTVFAAHTHTQPAQPSTVAHYLLAVVEQLERDAQRLRAAYLSTNQNPLGACAITGTGFPIDRERTTELLGFDRATGNTYGSIATVDYMLESVSAAAVLLSGLGRVLQDLLLWCTAEVAYLRLGDGFVQSSSIMPQKRNPVALEHARALASMALGLTSAIQLAVHNTPFGDIVDTEDDLQPLVTSMFAHAARAVALASAAMGTAEFDRDRMAARAREGWITVTELADTLTRDSDVPFKASHSVATAFVRAMGQNTDGPAKPASAILRDVSEAVLGRAVDYDEGRLREILSPEYFVRVRTTPGGPAASQIECAIRTSRESLTADEGWVTEAVARLKRADEALEEALRSL